MDFEKSKTKKNLEKAVQGEALAHLKYQFYKSKLSKITTEYDNLLDEIIHNEKEHGKIWFKQLHGGDIPENQVNLEDAMLGELFEYKEMYSHFSAVAEEEGFLEISELFYKVGKIEEQHYNEFKKLLNTFKHEEILFKSTDDLTEWKCSNCGHILLNNSAPEVCPVCNHPKRYFKQL